MSGNVNEVTLIGRLGKDPEFNLTSAGKRVANLSVATTEKWKDGKTGDSRERTEWHRVVIFNEHLVGIAERFLKKGYLIHARGALRTRNWVDKEGIERYTTEVVLNPFNSVLTLLSEPRGGGSGGYGNSGGQETGYNGNGAQPANGTPGRVAGGQPATGGAEGSMDGQRYTPITGTNAASGGNLDDDIPF